MIAENMNLLFLVGALLVGLSVVLSPLSSRLGVPILLVFLGVGILAGEDGPGGIQFNDYSTAYLVSNLALAVILLDGGLRTKMSSFRLALWPSLSLATLGVAITTVLTGLLAAWLFDLNLLMGLLIGAIVGSTDAAAVFSLLKGRALNERVGSTLEIESGSNDPMAVFLTVSLIAMIAAGGNFDGPGLMRDLALQAGMGLAAGFGGGYLIWHLVNRSVLADGLYPILVLAGGLLLFALSSLAGGSGILSIYLYGLFLGNRGMRGKHSTLAVMDGLTWLAQIGMFLVLGLLLTPSSLLEVLLPGLVLALGMIFIARPLAVWISLAPFKRFVARERWFISWVGLRGAVPIILAVFPMMAGLPNAELYFNLAFCVVLVSLLLQGSTLPLAMKLARVGLPPKPEPISRAGVDIFPASEWEIFVYRLKPNKWCVGEPLRRLSMPEGTRIAALFREHNLLHPSGSTELAADDVLCVLGQAKDLPALSQLFSEAPENPAMAGFFGDFMLATSVRLADLAPLYGFGLHEDEVGLTLEDLMHQKLGRNPVEGDSFEWQGCDWVVRTMEGDCPTCLGLKLKAG
ncbi:potassium/proton antiporter [Shewanella amazonensis]|uniref:K(+)/H(+) antiporter NhaP2 n=1 Tax=Shewanella amazonensis (strain ATCC BAA-1098 / SB2B) TaxID=326297 RepID=A1S3I1_SHEAM|nr:potassium/proton antiporter [Shewanella amazonensis]ABL98937.1 sodium/hydrogen exchanger family/TrkA domain protein [Shewanella amazonensis SB2B]